MPGVGGSAVAVVGVRGCGGGGGAEGGVGGRGGDGEGGGEGVGLAFVAAAGVEVAGDGFVGFGAGVDQGAEQFGVLVGQVAGELDAVLGGGQVQGFAGVGVVLVGFGAVGVDQVAEFLGGLAQLLRGQVAGQVDQLLFDHVAILGRDPGGVALESGHDGLGLGRMEHPVRGPRRAAVRRTVPALGLGVALGVDGAEADVRSSVVAGAGLVGVVDVVL